MKSFFQRMKLKTKAALIVGTILLLTLFTTTAIQLRMVTAELRSALQTQTLVLGEELVQEITKVLEFGLTLPDMEDLANRCQNLVAKHDDLAFAMVADREGTVRFHSDPTRQDSPVEKQLLDPSAAPSTESDVREVTILGDTVYATRIPINDNQGSYHGVVIIGIKGEVIAAAVAGPKVAGAISGVISFAVMLTFILLFITRQITLPLDRLSEAAGAVAGGDLTQEIKVSTSDEIGNLYGAFGNMLTSLRDLQGKVAGAFEELEGTVGEVTSHTAVLQTASDKQFGSVEEIKTFLQHMNKQVRNITGSMENLTRTSEETSSSILEMMASIEQVAQNSDSLSGSVNETSSSMEEVIVSNREVAQNIEHLDQLITQTSTGVAEFDASIKEIQNLAQESRKVAEEVRINAEKEGGAAVEETIKEMNTIRESVMTLSETVSTLSGSVDNIGAILSVIDDVAEQTNLLALNAAIIAAQAGEHGRGFAVVADEIRELAERTSSSTKEISKVISGIQTDTKKVDDLVKDGVNRVDRGTEAVGQTDRALRKIIDISEKSVEMSTRIAQATTEQSSGSREMARSIQDVSDRSSQISRATVEQSRGSENIIRSIESMREMAEQLRKATIEQKSGASLIAKAGEGTSLLAQEVRKSAQEGSDLSDQAVAEVENIASSAKETLEISSRMKEIVEKFDALSRNLKNTLSHFRT
jgi:methyl-accepting chemotaxis protein